MTDGIIQQAINKKKRDVSLLAVVKSPLDAFSNNTSFSDSVRMSMLLNELEQELIAEIEKRFNDKYCRHFNFSGEEIREYLIGDNQE